MKAVLGRISYNKAIYSYEFVEERSETGSFVTGNREGYSPSTFKETNVSVIDFSSVSLDKVVAFLKITKLEGCKETNHRATYTLEEFLKIAQDMGIPILNSKQVYESWLHQESLSN